MVNQMRRKINISRSYEVQFYSMLVSDVALVEIYMHRVIKNISDRATGNMTKINFQNLKYPTGKQLIRTSIT